MKLKVRHVYYNMSSINHKIVRVMSQMTVSLFFQHFALNSRGKKLAKLKDFLLISRTVFLNSRFCKNTHLASEIWQ